MNQAPTFRSRLVDLLLKMSRVMVIPNSIGSIDSEFCESYAETLEVIGVTIDELEFATGYLRAKSRWFPMPSDVVSIVQRLRLRHAEELHRAHMRELVECIDPATGKSLVAHPTRIMGGQLLPPGRFNSNPRPRELPSPEPPTKDEKLAVIERISPEARALFISILDDEGIDATCERKAAQAYRESA